MKVTPNYILPQIEGTDFFDKEVLNDGFRKIDTAISDIQESINILEPEAMNHIAELKDTMKKSEEVVSKNEELITKGGLATKGDIQVVNLQLEQKANKSEIGTPLVANSISSMTDTSRVYVNTTDGKWYSFNGSSWVVGGTYNSQGIADRSITNKKTNFFSYGKNLFNKDDITDGYYIKFNTGAMLELANYSASGYIDIIPGEAYTIGNFDTTSSKPIEQFSFYDESGVFVSGIAPTDTGSVGYYTFVAPARAYKVRLTIKTATKNVIQLEKGTQKTTYEDYVNPFISINKLDPTIKSFFETNEPNKKKLELYIKQDGTGDFTGLRTCFDYIRTLDYDEANIYISEGTYDVKSYFTSDEWINSSSFVGLKVPDNCNLIGVGEKSKVIIQGIDTEYREFISPLNLYNSAKIKNLTVIADRLRYCVHDDFATRNQKNGYVREVEDCVFIGTRLFHGYCYGSGTKGGAKWKFKNCTFINNTNNHGCFSIHDSEVQSKEDENILIDNCEFICKTSKALRFQSMNSGVKENVVINNSMFSGILLTESVAGDGNKYKISGGGNSKYLLTNNTTTNAFTRFSDEVINLYNLSGTKITKGTSVNLVDGYYISIANTGDTVYGYALEDIENDSYGYVKFL